MRDHNLSRFSTEHPPAGCTISVDLYASDSWNRVHIWAGSGDGPVSASLMLTAADVEKLYLALDEALARLAALEQG